MLNPGAQANRLIEGRIAESRTSHMVRLNPNTHMDRLMSVREFLDKTRYAGHFSNPAEVIFTHLYFSIEIGVYTPFFTVMLIDCKNGLKFNKL